MPNDAEVIVDNQENDSKDDLRSQLEAAVKEVNEKQVAEPVKEVEKEVAEKVEPIDRKVEASEKKEPAEIVRVPEAWSAAAKAKFASLPPDIQAEISKREVEIHKGFTRQDEDRQLGKTFKDAISPYMPMIRAEGLHPAAVVTELLQVNHELRNSNQQRKVDIICQLAQHFGVDSSEVINKLSGNGQQGFVDPQLQAYEQRVQRLEQERQQERYMQQQQQNQQINSVIQSFASDPKNIYFNSVSDKMSALLSSGHAKDLQEAYDQACWADPNIRPVLLQQQQEAARNEAREKANKARLAGGSLSGSPSVAVPASVPNRSLREELEANLRAAQGRA